jgi:hypothetical protein
VIKQGRNKSKMNLIGALEIGEEYGVCPLLFWGRSSDLQNDPNLQANLNFQADPTNKSSVLQDGWGIFASRLSQYKFKSSVFSGWVVMLLVGNP